MIEDIKRWWERRKQRAAYEKRLEESMRMRREAADKVLHDCLQELTDHPYRQHVTKINPPPLPPVLRAKEK